MILLLALVLIVGGTVYHDGPADNHEPDQHGHNEHHDHYQPPPFAEMLPPIGPVGFVLMGAVAEMRLEEAVDDAPQSEPDDWNPDQADSDYDGPRRSGRRSKEGPPPP